MDPLIALAWLAGATTRIKLGVLIPPYRPPLPAAKQIASLQELSGERLLLGAGIGWMDAEFRALGVDRQVDANIALKGASVRGRVQMASATPESPAVAH